MCVCVCVCVCVCERERERMNVCVCGGRGLTPSQPWRLYQGTERERLVCFFPFFFP